MTAVLSIAAIADPVVIADVVLGGHEAHHVGHLDGETQGGTGSKPTEWPTGKAKTLPSNPDRS